MSSITDDAKAFMQEIGLMDDESASSSSKSKKKNKVSQEDKSGSEKSGKKKNNSRKWGKEKKNKSNVSAVAGTNEVTVSRVNHSQMKEVIWLKNYSPSTSGPLITLDEGQNWYSLLRVFDGIDPAAHRTNKENIKTIVQFAEHSFQTEVALFRKIKNSSTFSQDQKWVDEILKTGTLSDKVAALALQVQKSPPHELEALDSLVTLALKKEQRTSQLALEALKDLLLHNLLPDRRLKPIMAQPLGHDNLTPAVVTMFWFEVELMKRTERIVDAIEIGLKSTVDYFKRFCMELVFEWLVAKPEQEGRLLSLLVNKLGDPTNKICSKGVELLGKLVCRHTSMKGVVVREVRQLISRPNLPPRAVYSGIIFLSQIKLSMKDQDVSTQLVQCYVSLFEKAVTQDKLGSKLLVALLIGINRAYPFLQDKESIIQHLDALFRIVHSASFSTSTQALTLISHIILSSEGDSKSTQRNGSEIPTTIENNLSNSASQSKADVDLSNRYYRALYSQLLADQLQTRSHNTLFLNLLFRSMKRDPSDSRVIAFVKRILISATHSTAPIAAGLIFLVSEVFQAKPGLYKAMLEVEDASPKSQVVDSNYWLLGNFDASKRDASHACPNTPSIWEISLFNSHYHPSVQAFTTSFLDPTKKHTIKYDGDPTSDFSLSSFLNRFAYKNPKKSQFELRRKRSQTSQEEPVNSMQIQDMGKGDIAPEKEFFRKFFSDRSRLREKGLSRDRSRHKEKSEDGGESGSDFEEDEMDKFADKLALDLMASAGNGPADIDDDDDLMSDNDNDNDSQSDDENGGDDMDGANFVDEFSSDDDEQEVELDEDSDIEHDTIRRSKKRSLDDQFASAESYEEDMEAIVNAHSLKASDVALDNEDEVPSKKSKKDRKKMKK